MLDSIDSESVGDLLGARYSQNSLGRKPYDPIRMLKAQLLKHLLRIPSDRRLALRLKNDREAAKIYGFRKRTPCHSLFTHFRHRLGEETYHQVFNQLLGRLLAKRVVRGKTVAVDSTYIQAYSQRSMDDKAGKSDPDARVDRGRRGFILGYRVHTVCCTDSELPLAFRVAPCNENDKLYFKPLLEKLQQNSIAFRTIVADTQYSSEQVRTDAEQCGAKPVIPVRKDSRMKKGLRVGKDFVVRGMSRLVKVFKKRMSIERLFSRAKEWLLLSSLRVRGLKQVTIHVSLSLIAMLAIAITAIQEAKPRLMRRIKHYTT